MLCPTCKYNNFSTNAFCVNCGTKLEGNLDDTRRTPSSGSFEDSSQGLDETQMYRMPQDFYDEADSAGAVDSVDDVNKESQYNREQVYYDYNTPYNYSRDAQYYAGQSQAAYDQDIQDSYGEYAEQPKKKSSWTWLILIAILAVLIPIAVGIIAFLFMRSETIDPYRVQTMSDADLLALIQEQEDISFIGIDADIAFTEVEIDSFELTSEITDDPLDYYRAVGELEQENDEFKIVHDAAEFSLIWNNEEEYWNLYSVTSRDNVQTPKFGAPDSDIKNALDRFTYQTDDGRYWLVDSDSYDGYEITDRELSDDGLREAVDVNVLFSDVVTEIIAEVELVFEYSVGSWTLDYRSSELEDISTQPKDGTIFVFDEETVYYLWAGETLGLVENTDSGDLITIPIPEDADIVENVLINDYVEGIEPGQYDVDYQFDIEIDDWFSLTWFVEQRFEFNPEDNTYYVVADYSQYSWEINEADLSGDWYGTFRDTDGRLFKMQLTLEPMSNDANSYEAIVLAQSPEGDLGSFDGTAELNTSTLAFTLNPGSWIDETDGFYRFRLSGFLFPETEIIEGSSLGILSLSRDEESVEFTDPTTTVDETEETTEGASEGETDTTTEPVETTTTTSSDAND